MLLARCAQGVALLLRAPCAGVAGLRASAWQPVCMPLQVPAALPRDAAPRPCCARAHLLCTPHGAAGAAWLLAAAVLLLPPAAAAVLLLPPAAAAAAAAAAPSLPLVC